MSGSSILTSLGRALADGYREKVKLATKLPSWLIERRKDMKKFLNAQLEKLKIASQCVHCGQCLEKCPQHIDIPTVLESVVEELEGSDFEQRVAMAREMFKRT